MARTAKEGWICEPRKRPFEGGESGAVIQPGQPDDSLLIEYVESHEMPPGRPLPAEEITILRRWIAEGPYLPAAAINPLAVSTSQRAGYDWWSLQPLADPVPPIPGGVPEIWTHHPIDRFVAAKLEKMGLRPSAPADRATLIRRASYDLTGLPPSIEELASFVHDTRPDAYEQLIDRLLQSPHYGQHWARHWLDVIRFGESRGFERNEIVNNAWPFRDYVIRSLNDDKPFDQLVVEHLAGDVVGHNDPTVEVGTTFLVCGPYDDVGNQDPIQAAQIRANTIDDMIRAAGESFLGLTIGCARCHDHKFDPIPQGDYYRLYATLAGVQHGERAVATAEARKQHLAQLQPLQMARQQRIKRKADLQEAILARAKARATQQEMSFTRPTVQRTGTEESFPPVEARYVRLTIQGVDTNPHSPVGCRIDEFEVWTGEPAPRNVALAQHGAVAQGDSRTVDDFAEAYGPGLTIDGRFGACWIAEGPELTIKLARPETVCRVFFSSDRGGAAGQHAVATFVTDYRIHVSLDGRTWSQVASSHDRQPVGTAHRRQRLLDSETTDDERRQLAQRDDELAEADRQLASVDPLPAWWVGQFEKHEGPYHVFLGGDPQKLGSPVTPASMSFLDQLVPPYQLSPQTPGGQRRMALAQWIVADSNPLTPRC